MESMTHPDIPFQHRLTQRCSKFLTECPEEIETITGYCHDPVWFPGRPFPIFFRAGLHESGIQKVKNEHRLLSELHDCPNVPKIVTVHDTGDKYILFTEYIDAVSLDTIPSSDPRWKDGIVGALGILHKLYLEKELLHRDMHPGNIMISPTGKVYLVDFESSSLGNVDARKNWISDLLVFCNGIEDVDDAVFQKMEEFDGKLEQLRADGRIEPELYQTYIDEFLSILPDPVVK